MESSLASGLVCVSWLQDVGRCSAEANNLFIGQIDREGNARKVVNCSCVVVRDWGEESTERSILLNYFNTEQ